MKDDRDTQTQELPTLGVGNPAVFELDERAPWPMPKPDAGNPASARDKVLEPFKRWLERVATS